MFLAASSLISFLGQCVRVVEDRPLGSAHPRHPDLIYPVNHGEIPDTVSGGGLPIDAYLLGWNEPVSETSGTVVAVVERINDLEDKLVVGKLGTYWTDEEIWQAVHFQEKFFEMRLRR